MIISKIASMTGEHAIVKFSIVNGADAIINMEINNDIDNNIKGE
jgi:hypothetical protein